MSCYTVNGFVVAADDYYTHFENVMETNY